MSSNFIDKMCKILENWIDSQKIFKFEQRASEKDKVYELKQDDDFSTWLNIEQKI